MAGDWIVWTKGLASKPEVLTMSTLLNLDRWAIAGRLMEVWEWFDSETENGYARGVTFAFLNERVCCEHFAETMHKVGWLDMKKGQVLIPGFTDWNGKSAKKRLKSRKRMQDMRAKRYASSVTSASPHYTTDHSNRETPLEPLPHSLSVTEGTRVADGSDGALPKQKQQRRTWLRNVTDEDLLDDSRLANLFAKSVNSGFVSDCENDRFLFMAMACHCLAAEKPAAMFAVNISTSNWKVINNTDEERAAKRLKEAGDESYETAR